MLVLQASAGALGFQRFIPLGGNPFGMRLSPDGNIIYVASGDRVLMVDVALAVDRGEEPVVGVIEDSSFAGAVMVNVTSDNQLMFVSQERAAAISVVDLGALKPIALSVTGIASCGGQQTPGVVRDCVRSRPSGYSGARLVGSIPTGRAPIALEFSADGAYLFATSQEAPVTLDTPIECRPQANRSGAPDHRAGAVMVIDVRRAATDPAGAGVRAVKAGCNPVRLALSRDGSRMYVSARTDDQLLVFETADLLSGAQPAPVARVNVGTAPVGLAVLPDNRVIVTSSNRFAGTSTDRQDLYVVDGDRTRAGAVIGRIPAGAFPRQVTLAPDGRTLYVTNFTSRTVQIIDVPRAIGSLVRPPGLSLGSQRHDRRHARHSQRR